MATSAQRRAAQRKLAKEIHEGTYKPSSIGKKAREIVGASQLINEIQILKAQLFMRSPNWNPTSSKRHIAVNARTGKPRTVKELKDIKERMEEKIDNLDFNMDNTFYRWHYVFEDLEPDYQMAGFYK